MACYFVAQIEILDRDAYDRYLDGFDEVFARFDGAVLAVDDEVRTLEGTWPLRRTVLIRFPDEAALLAWYESAEYQRLAAVRRSGSVANIALVHGSD